MEPSWDSIVLAQCHTLLKTKAQEERQDMRTAGPCPVVGPRLVGKGLV